MCEVMGRTSTQVFIFALSAALGATALDVRSGVEAYAQQAVTAERFVVITGHRDATLAALEVLARGGNVMDRAITASMCVGVAEPYGSGLGGKLMLLYRDGKSG